MSPAVQCLHVDLMGEQKGTLLSGSSDHHPMLLSTDLTRSPGHFVACISVFAAEEALILGSNGEARIVTCGASTHMQDGVR